MRSAPRRDDGKCTGCPPPPNKNPGYAVALLSYFIYDILHIFYTSMIESIICYNISLWWSSMNANDKKALNRITKQAAKVTHSELTYIDDLYCNIVTKKVKCIMANSCHALHDYYTYMRTGTRLCALSCRTHRYRKSCAAVKHVLMM